jgi:hypothetical protein
MPIAFGVHLSINLGINNKWSEIAMKKEFLLMTFSFISLTSPANSQSFYYSSKEKQDTLEVYGINLQTNAKTLIFTDTLNPYGNILWDPTQHWVFIERDNSYLGKSMGVRDYCITMEAVDVANPSHRHSFPNQFPHPSNTYPHTFIGGLGARGEVLDGIVFNPVKNVFYVTWYLPDTTGLGNPDPANQRTAIFDASSFDVLDTLPVPPGWITGVSSVSDDGNYLYVEKFEHTEKTEAIGKYSLLTKQLIINRDISNIVVNGGYKDVDDSKKGRYLIQYLYPSLDLADKKFSVYDIDRDATNCIIPFSLVANGSISSDGKYVIIEETPVRPDYATSTSGDDVLHPGRISIFDGFSSKLIQKLNLPPDGRVLVFDDYPNMLYYYLPNEQHSININLSKLANITSLSPAFAYAGSSAFTITVNGKDFANGSIVNWGGVAKITTFVADSILQASILASDIAVVDSPLVTVKNTDGTAESNSIRFYIKQPPPITGCNVKLINSSGTKLTGGALQYYEGSWKDAVNNNDGTFFVNTTAKTISLRMTYEYGTQTKSNITVGPDTVVFQTVNTQIQLQDSKGSFLDTGAVQYYGGAWRSLGATISGVASKELLPGNYSFRMTYAYASKDKQQDISANSTVVFQTVNAQVQLQNSQGGLMDQGTVQYYSGAWRDFGVTTNGVASKELLPNNYSFRMAYAFASKDKQQDIGANPTVVFQTVNASVQLENSQGSLMPSPLGDQGTVQYYAGAWRDFGNTTGGVANKELLPNSYSFRMTYEYVSLDKTQDLSTNSTVSFSTVLCTIRVKNAQSQPVDGATASYYSGAWRQIGTTVNGEVTRELLPVNLTFRVNYGTQQQDKTQNLSINNIVDFNIQP